MTEFDFDLADRVQKIKSINEQYDLENNAFISFSGGKDSTVLSKIIDIALPGNKIPRVFFNTGIEYKGEKHTIAEWAGLYNLSYSALFHRLSIGWSLDKALNTKVGYRCQK